MNHQINIDEAIAIAKEYHLETDEWYQIDSTLICDYCIIPEADYILKIILKVKIMKTRKHFIRKYELLVRCIQTNLEFFIA